MFKYFSTVTIHQGKARISYIAEGLIVKSLNSDSLMSEILLDYWPQVDICGCLDKTPMHGNRSFDIDLNQKRMKIMWKTSCSKEYVVYFADTLHDE